MKRIVLLLLLIILFVSGFVHAQILNVKETFQEQDQWCWAGVSACVLDYYGKPTSQCRIAEYARTVITWSSFGDSNCCDNPNSGCNNANYMFDFLGSIEDIILHYANLHCLHGNYILTSSDIYSDINDSRPIFARWGWYSGGGHFLVIHGISDSLLYYMNPWFGEGKKISDLSWFSDDGNHSWTHTMRILNKPTDVDEKEIYSSQVSIFPNPTTGIINIKSENIKSENISSENISSDNISKLELFDSYGNTIKKLNGGFENIDLTGSVPGVYFAKVTISSGEIRVIPFVLEN